MYKRLDHRDIKKKLIEVSMRCGVTFSATDLLINFVLKQEAFGQ